MGTTTFTADSDKIVTINGKVYNLTVPELPAGVSLYANEVKLEAGQTYPISANITLKVEAAASGDSTVLFALKNTAVAQVVADGGATTNVKNGDTFSFVAGQNYTVKAEGATEIPTVTVGGSGLTTVTVNNEKISLDKLPYTFQPLAASTNSVYVTGENTGTNPVTLTGVDIEGCTVNGEEVTLPYTFTPTEPTQVAMAGEIYQLDLNTPGGAKVTLNGKTVTGGNEAYHEVLDVDKNMYVEIDGEHDIIINGENIKSVIVNGVSRDVSELPAYLKNRAMVAHIDIEGYAPSEFHIVGNYLDTVTLDGKDVPVGANGSIDIEVEVREENHFINLIGSQPREYQLSFTDYGTTKIFLDGVQQKDGTVTTISHDVHISAEPKPVPVHFENAETVTIDVDGIKHTEMDFTIEVARTTEIDIDTKTCLLTIDYGDESTSIRVPQQVVYITAPHRDGWIFDGWSSSNVGIVNPKSVRTALNLVGKSEAALVSHYQRFVTCNKPNMWN